MDIIRSDLLADLQGLVLLWTLEWLLLLFELEVLVYLVLVSVQAVLFLPYKLIISSTIIYN